MAINYEKEYVGKELETKVGRVLVLSYEGNRYLKVKFLDSYGYSYNVRVDHLDEGATKNPYYPTVFSKGYLGEGQFARAVQGKDTKLYVRWHSMLTRVYDKNYLDKFPTYKGAEISNEWHNFQTFAVWAFSQKNWEQLELDKDLLFRGNKKYSEQTCLFIPKELNKALDITVNKTSSGYVGVQARESGYQVCLGKYGKRVHVCFTKDLNYAVKMYFKAKADHLVELAHKFKGVMSDMAYEATINRAKILQE